MDAQSKFAIHAACREGKCELAPVIIESHTTGTQITDIQNPTVSTVQSLLNVSPLWKCPLILRPWGLGPMMPS